MSSLSSVPVTAFPAGSTGPLLSILTSVGDTRNPPRMEGQLLLRFQERKEKQQRKSPQQSYHLIVQTLQTLVHLGKLQGKKRGAGRLDQMLAKLQGAWIPSLPGVCSPACSIAPWKTGAAGRGCPGEGRVAPCQCTTCSQVLPPAGPCRAKVRLQAVFSRGEVGTTELSFSRRVMCSEECWLLSGRAWAQIPKK